MFVLFAPARHVKCNGCEKMCKCEDNLNNHTDSEHPKKAFQSGPAAGAHIVCTIAAAMLTLFTAHKLTPQLPPLPSHRSPDTTTSHYSENNTRLSFSRMFHWPGVLYTSGKLRVPNIYSCSREFVCLCAFPAGCQSHFQPVPVAFSSCQLHSSFHPLPVSSSPNHHTWPRNLSIERSRLL